VTAAKVANKGVFKTAAKALSKMAASKAVAVLGGAAVGAAIGSVLPGVGTAVVGALGGVIGGLAIDGALLRLEEVLRGVLSSHRQRASRRRECNEQHGCDCDEWD
jgi:phage tail tape-measure protein